MHEKKWKLIKAGMKLFTAKGYHQTSIQEIASAAGVSKGSFYIYFESKEQFILTAIQHFYGQMTDNVKQIRMAEQDPRESFEKQIHTIIEYIYTYKDFIIMHLRENNSVSEQTDKMLEQMQLSSFQSLCKSIVAIYGEQVQEILVDIVIQMEGLINAYSKWIVMDEIQVERERIGAFLVRRLDDIVTGMLEQNEQALTFIPEKYHGTLTCGKAIDPSLSIPRMMKDKILLLEAGTEKVKQLLDVVQLLDAELAKEEIQPIMIQGLLAHFKEIPELQQECEQLAETINIELLK